MLPIEEPMYASVADHVPEGEEWVFEPKYDGMRVLAFAAPGSATRLVTRNGADKATQFPEIADAIAALARRKRQPLVLDGEVVALDAEGRPARFQQLQSRLHVKQGSLRSRLAAETPAALLAFDVLQRGAKRLTDAPWHERRAVLESLVPNDAAGPLRLGDVVEGSGRAALTEARRGGWEGVIAKHRDARYRPGVRSPDWRKLKIEGRQELVVGGFTEPRRTRPYLGALLLGYYDTDGRLVYAGHTGGGFTHEGLRQMRARLDPLERKTSPFADPPRPNEIVHWVTPRIVVEVKFNEWTDDGRLRQPIYLGTRDDKAAKDVVREPRSVQHGW
jgi:bifunctional non-homologous end joining protein LigD